MTKNMFEWIPQNGQIIHNRIQLEVNPGIAPAAGGGNRILKTEVADYSDASWEREMVKHDSTIAMKDLQCTCLRTEMGRDWDS